MAAVALALALVAAPRTPFEALAHQHGFRVAHLGSTRTDGYSGSRLSHSEGTTILLQGRRCHESTTNEFEHMIGGSPGLIAHPGGIRFNLQAFDGAPIGVVVPVKFGSALIRLGDIDEGHPVQTVWSSVDFLPGISLIGSHIKTTFFWKEFKKPGEPIGFATGVDKSLQLDVVSLTRWHNSEHTGRVLFEDQEFRMMGNGVVVLMGDDEAPYVDMNELSRHRGWNFTISLEPARADVRIGDDHIRIYPGADRIHINNELVTLPGTVPTQGYGVYLPLRLLQERGYLPAEN